MNDNPQRKILDEKLLPLRNSVPQTPPGGWVSAIRKALSMSSKQLGKRIGIVQSAVSELERSEIERTITLKSLDRLAHAMNCEVRYTLIPRDSLKDTVWKQAEKVLEIERKSISRTMTLEDQKVPLKTDADYLQIMAFLAKNEKKIWDEL
jgi:predicted DNA-binding mobile mystery protein A